jgi:hypothetical protein
MDFREVDARAKTDTGSSCIIIGHIAWNPWEVNPIDTSGEDESEAGPVSSVNPRSAQIRGAV